MQYMANVLSLLPIYTYLEGSYQSFVLKGTIYQPKNKTTVCAQKMRLYIILENFPVPFMFKIKLLCAQK